MFTSLLYNVNVATSITSQGRTAVASMMCCFEQFLSNSVKFGSLDEVLVFIDHVKSERFTMRKYKDSDILDRDIDPAECLYKIAWSCGYRWVPNYDELDIIFKALNNLGQEDLNRVYYKNNLYEFLSNSYMKNLIIRIMKTLETPYMSPAKPPKEIQDLLDEFADLLKEYVYYGYMIIDRIDRAENMIKNVCIISDTDSTIISLDAWFRFANELVKYEDLKIKRYRPYQVLDFLEQDEFGDFTDKTLLQPFTFDDPEYDYDFENDELIEMKHVIDPLEIYPEDNVRHSIINIMAYVLDKVVNDYMCNVTKASHSFAEGKECRLYAKTEF